MGRGGGHAVPGWGLKRIILHAHAAVENLGDRLIVDAIRSALTARLPAHDLVFRDAPPRDSGDVGREVGAADLVLIGGGELVGPHPAYLDLGLMAAAAGVPTVWLGVGGCVDGGRLDRAYIRAVLRRAKAVVTRDRRTFDHLSQEVPAVRLHDGVDVAFSWKPPRLAAAEVRSEFGVCLRGPEQRDRPWDRQVFARLAREIESLTKHRLSPVFFTFLSERDARRIGSANIAGSFCSDSEVHAFVQEQMGGPPVEVVVAEGDLGRVYDRIRSLRFMLSMRLHALVLSAHAGVPFIALDYAPKVEEFARLTGAEECLVRPDEVGTKLPRLAARLLDDGQHEARSHALAAATDHLRKLAWAQLEQVVPWLEAPPPRSPRRMRLALATHCLRLLALHRRL